MGHGQKNANRGAAINRNAARVEELAKQLKNLGNLMKDMKREGMDETNEIMVVMDEVHEAFEERIRLLERPLWKKLLRRDLEAPSPNLEDADFEKDVLPEIEKQTGEIPAEVKEEAKADAMAMAVKGSTPVLGEFVEAVIKEQKEAEMKKKDEEKEKERPATPSHRQVIVDRAVPGPKKKEEPDETKAVTRDA